GCARHLIGVGRWMGLEERVQIDWLRDARVVTQIGVDPRLRFVGSKNDLIDLASGVTAGSVNAYTNYERALAVYAEQTARPVDWLAFNVGARFDLDDEFGSRLSPRAAVVVAPWKGAALKVIYAEAFRAPNSAERRLLDPQFLVQADNL